jgi:hypothetical protein
MAEAQVAGRLPVGRERAEAANPRIPSALRTVLGIETVVLAGVGLLLFFAPGFAGRNWPWQMTPFGVRFLGATYLSSLSAVGMLWLLPRRAPARLVLPMAAVFETVILVVSLVYVSRFETDRLASLGWAILYIGLPVITTFYIWRFRRLPAALAVATPAPWRVFMVALGVVLGAYGVAMVVAPHGATAFWPWPFDGFTARIYCAEFLTAAVGLLLLARVAAPVELLTLGLVLLVLGAFTIAGVVVVDRTVNAVHWSSGGTVFWLAAYAVLIASGAALIGRAALSRG